MSHDKRSLSRRDSGSPQIPSENARQRASAVLRTALTVLQEHGTLFLLLSALCLAAAGVWYGINKQPDPWVQGLLSGGLGFGALYALLRPDDVRRVLAGRTARRSSNSLVLAIATVGILVLLNYLSTRYYKRLDVTQAKLHSLSSQSIQVLQELDAEIEVIGLYPNGEGQDSFEKWVDEYMAHTDRLRYRSIDPIRQPGEAEQLGWNAYGGGLILRQGTRSQQVLTADEQDITSGLLKVSRDTQKVVYFLTGHNEHSPTSYEGTGYGRVGSILSDNNYQVQTLNLAVTDTVPLDAAVVVVAGPQTPFLQAEKERLTQYLLAGGKALIMVDPGPETGINDVLAPWKVRIENRLAVDARQSLPGDPLTPAIDVYRFSQITKDLPMIALPVASPIQRFATEQLITFTPLAMTSEQSWAESDLENPEVRYDEGEDTPGPLALVATIESPPLATLSAAADEVKTRLVLIGDSDFVSNDILDQIPNGQFLMMNAVNWLAEEETLIAIGPKTRPNRSIRLTQIQEGAVCFGTLILIPAVIVVAGLVVWFQRRRQR